MNTQVCRVCDTELRQSFTTFTVVKDVAVYVVKDVPCLECPDCGEVTFDQETANKLSQYASGRAWPSQRPLSAYVFRWDEPLILLLLSETPYAATENKSVGKPATSELKENLFTYR